MTNLEKGQKITRVMNRYNPQLGSYTKRSEAEVIKITKRTITVLNHYGDKEKYCRDTLRIMDDSECCYGSVDYSLELG